MNTIKTTKTLLERKPTQEYLEEWTSLLNKPLINEKENQSQSFITFRIGKEWFALKTTIFKEVIQQRPIHRIPHRSGKILIGLLNLNGELQLCIALNHLLEIQATQILSKRLFHYQQNRMIAIEKEGDLWVFPVDEVDGVHVWKKNLIENVPVNVTKSTVNYLKGIINIEEKSIGIIDEDFLFYSLRRGIL